MVLKLEECKPLWGLHDQATIALTVPSLAEGDSATLLCLCLRRYTSSLASFSGAVFAECSKLNS